MTWLGLTLLLLVLGYVWLSTYANSTSPQPNRNAVRKLNSADLSNTPLTTPKPVKKVAEMEITRGNDESRAEDYLAYEAIQQKILPLLDMADVHFESEQYVTPLGDNAWEDYQAILGLNPSEPVAIAGLTKIKSKLISNAEQAVDRSDIAAAENWLVQLDTIQPDGDTQKDLRVEIKKLVAIETERKLREQEAEELRNKIETTLSQAADEEQKDNSNINKVQDLYDRVLELDPENTTAKQGLFALSDRKLDAAEQALREGDLEQTAADIKTAIAIYPDNKRISSLELAYSASLKQQEQEKEQQEILARQEEVRKQDEIKRQEDARKQEQLLAQQQAAKAASQTNSAVSSNTPQPPSTPKATPVSPEPPAQSTARQPPLASGVIAQARKATTPPSLPTSQSPTQNSTALRNGIKAYYNGDYNLSFELLYPLAQDNVARAQFRIGIMYQFGRSVARNTDLAEKWFTAALPELLRKAQEGVPWAQTDLGTAYEFGISLQQDYARAAHWYQLAADQGYPGAQTNLGVLYAQGDGVPYNRSEAVFWFRKAAEQGDRVAIENLGILGIKL